ncbi:MAG: acyltransferase family protein, partial [Treponema sp.]|nr:acyltransferase family protein [Treponema sp.]
MTEQKKQVYPVVDIIKLLFAFLIVLMHAELLNPSIVIEYRLQITVFALIVPFFFVSAGFFLGKRIDGTNDNIQIIKITLIRYLKLYLIFGGWYLTVNLLKAGLIDKDKQTIIHLFHQLIVETPGGGIWFVYTLVWCVLILYAIKGNKSKCIIIWLVFATIYLLGAYFFSKQLDNSEVRRIYNMMFLSEHNLMFYGVFFFGGFLLGANSIYERIKKWKYIYILIIVIYLLFGLLLYDWNDLFQVVVFSIMKAASVFSLFGLAILKSDDTSINISIIRKISTVLYFTHWNFIYVVIFLRERVEL